VPQPSLSDDVQDRIAFPSRLLSTQVLYLIGTVDQGPPLTAGSQVRARELQDQWLQLASERDQILAVDMAAFNALLADGGVPHVVPQSL
jgi:hypothetical protein